MAKHYDLNAVDLIVGGIPLSGYGENGGIEFEDERDLGQMTVGADGLAVFSANNSEALFATITFLESARSYTLLAGLMETQRALTRLGGVVPPTPFLMLDRVNGDSVSSAMAWFVQRPMQSKARTVGERVFRLALPKAVRTYGVLNVSPF